MIESLLLPSSSIFKDSELIDKIHQSYINLKDGAPEDEVRDLLQEALSYLNENLTPDLANELFSLISLCFLQYPTQFIPIFETLWEKSRKNYIYIITTTSVLSQLIFANPKKSLPDYSNYVTNALNDILIQIQKNDVENIFVFGHKIPQQFQYDLIIDLLLLSNLTDELLKNFLPFIITQKFYSQNPNFFSLIK